MPEDADQPGGSRQSCGCFAAPLEHLVAVQELGLDAHYAEVSLLACRVCGAHWLRYFYEVEAFSGSGRWYLGPLTPGQRSALTLQGAKSVLEALDWYYCGGSYYGGLVARSAGEIPLSP